MKHLKIFEDFKLGTAYAHESPHLLFPPIDGFEVIVDHRSNFSVEGKTIYTVEEVIGKSLSMAPICFKELDKAREYIEGLIDNEKMEMGKNKFVIRILYLDSSSPGETDVDLPRLLKNNKESQLNSTKVYDHIEKYINVLVDAYVAITPQRYKATFTKDVIRKGLVRLQQECKFNDLSRTKEAIKVFNDLMTPMMEDVHKSKNIETWKLGSNGKKYYSVFKDFRNMARLI
jgi:hypothetical protein